MEAVFIYAKGDIIKVLNAEDSKRQHDALIADGWVYASGRNPCVYIQFLFNSTDEEIIKSVRELNQ